MYVYKYIYLYRIAKESGEKEVPLRIMLLIIFTNPN